jgi:protein SCO1/2
MTLLRLTAAACLVLAPIVSGAACRRPPAELRQYDFSGTVVKIEGRQVTIAHDRIEGYMDAMVMPFTVKEQWAYGVMQPGDSVRAVLAVQGGRSWLEQIVITKVPPGSELPAPGTRREAPPGDTVPDFELRDQDGRPVRFAGYRGDVLIVSFVYTRCPLPDYCPWVMRRFADLHRRLKEDPALYGRTRLLTISFDPKHDTPEVLRAYGDVYGADADARASGRWILASGTDEQIRDVAGFFGLEYWQATGEIVHSLRTVVIAPAGTVVRTFPGNEWQVDEVLCEIRTIRRP